MTKKVEVGDDEMGRIHKIANTRKRNMFWIGFLSGALASGRIEVAEIPAIQAEARGFAKFFEDPDANDLVQDIAFVHDPLQNDLFEQIEGVIDAKRSEVAESGPFTDKDRVNEFLGFCAGVICDNKLYEAEVRAIQLRFDEEPLLKDHNMLVDLHRIVGEALADGWLSADEEEDVRSWIARIVGDSYWDTGMPSVGNVSMISNMIDDSADITFSGKTFVLTGAVKMAPRKQIKEMIERLNGTFGKGVTTKTDYLVVASTASRDWSATHFGTKIQRAEELLSSGHYIRLVPEYLFEEAIRQSLSA